MAQISKQTDGLAEQPKTGGWRDFVRRLMHDNHLPWELARLVLIIYPLLCAVLFFTQRHLMYYPSAEMMPPPAAIATQVAEIGTTTADGLRLTHLFVPPTQADGPIILLAHGNAGNASSRLFKARVFAKERGWGSLIVGYRGYGGNPGDPSEDGLIADARSAYDWLATHHPAAPQIWYGESIGSGVTMGLVALPEAKPPRLVVLEAPFSSAIDVARRTWFWIPLNLLMRDKFLSTDRMAALRSPIIILHGEQDREIPIALGRRLFGKVPVGLKKKFLSVSGAGHNDLYASQATVAALLEQMDRMLALPPEPAPEQGPVSAPEQAP